MIARTRHVGAHRAAPTPTRTGAAVRRTSTSVIIASTLAVGVGSGAAWAVPDQGGVTPAPEQGGVTPTPEQGGTTPEPAPAPVAPVYDPGPGIVPSPPSTSDWQPAPTYEEPTFGNAYNPAPSGPIHAPVNTAPVKRIAPPPKTLRVGNIVVPAEDIPEVPNKVKAIRSANEWAAYAEAEIARGLISIGVPDDEASRKAAATVIGVAAGGAIGGIVVFTATTLAVGVVTVPLGAVIGGTIGAAISGTPVTAPFIVTNTLGGAAIGGAVGGAVAVGAGALAGAGAATVGGLIGGVMAYALGSGDPGASAEQPKLPWTPDEDVQPLPNPDGNQFEFRLPPASAKKAGLPAVEYIVTKRGDVNISTRIGNQNHTFGWSAEAAKGPIKALGTFAPLAKKAINDATRARTDQVEKDIPGADARWPQEEQPAEAAAL